MFAKVLIANRGEIACRIIRTCRALGIHTVAVHSPAEANPLHAELADEAYALPQRDTPAAAYLDAAAVTQIAVQSGADAIHPGYGFLSESPALAAECARSRIAFVGPPTDVARLMADKWAARSKMTELGVPVLPGEKVPADNSQAVAAAAERIGLPLMVKATDGGGGIGMQIVQSQARLERAARRASSSALRAFGSADVYLERYLPDSRHIEVQIIADTRGNVHQLGERECSVQRRHQKVIEEAPAPGLDDALRRALLDMSVNAARATNYVGAGTFEYILSAEQDAYFLEANTRLQVEHGVTEMVTGVDIVEQQLRAAAGLPLSIDAEPRLNGSAIECRIYAEDPRTFIPSPGTLDAFDTPTIANLRVDTGYRAGDAVTPFFDPLLAKLIAWGEDRQAAITLMRDAIDATQISGVKTNIPTLSAALAHPDFTAGRYTTALLDNLT